MYWRKVEEMRYKRWKVGENKIYAKEKYIAYYLNVRKMKAHDFSTVFKQYLKHSEEYCKLLPNVIKKKSIQSINILLPEYRESLTLRFKQHI